MNYLDLSFLTLIAFITVRGLFRGLITELMVLVALSLGVITATVLHPPLQLKILEFFPDIPIAVAKVSAFVVIFLAVNIFIRLLSKTLNKIATFTFLQPVNKLAGALFAFTKITLIISIVLNGIILFPGSDYFLQKMGKDDSLVYEPVQKFAPVLKNLFFPGDESSIKDMIPFDEINPDSTASDILKHLK
ncbi:MAG: CvpA family protein [Calditrichaeota bacterium]|nr:MAG: CvpA family protein [Calditrichota bacterium]MBL1204425.1 CvpA family protein [Calditrichota bacterium]NOG44254.1 CvpA family protein [Calditrichota bacterium]